MWFCTTLPLADGLKCHKTNSNLIFLLKNKILKAAWDLSNQQKAELLWVQIDKLLGQYQQHTGEPFKGEESQYSKLTDLAQKLTGQNIPLPILKKMWGSSNADCCSSYLLLHLPHLWAAGAHGLCSIRGMVKRQAKRLPETWISMLSRWMNVSIILNGQLLDNSSLDCWLWFVQMKRHKEEK